MLVAAVRVSQGARVMGTLILTLQYEQTLEQVFQAWNSTSG
jgi:hypothetical protein